MPTILPQYSGQKQQIEWKRFWCPIGSSINCGDNGRSFLADPEGESNIGVNPNVREIEHLIPEIGPLILCGDPGIGKTNEFQRLKSILRKTENPDRVLALTFRLHISNIQEFRQRTVESTSWQEWKNEGGHLTLMIDGIDEGLIRIPTFISALRGLLEDETVDRLRLILTCRSAEWPDNQGDSLLGLWQGREDALKPVYELCPLRFKDFQQAAETWGINSDKFGDAIWKAQATGLATRPVTLFLLRDEFLKSGSLPSSHRELFRRGTTKLVGEVDPERLEILRAARGAAVVASVEERLKSAQCLAALLLCCGKNAIRRGESSDDLSDDHALQITQAFQAGTSLSLAAGMEAIESALFTSVGHERFGFAHQTFAECLGSIQLSELPCSQVRRLLMQRDGAGEHVVPQLTELAAWTAGNHTQFCQNLLQNDPTALLHCDASILSDTTKSQLVESILSGVKAGRILDDYQFYRFFHTLKHADIVAQLKPYITDKTADSDSRSMAIEIAKRCQLSEVSDDLFAIIKEETGSLRECAAEALCEIIPKKRLSEIEPLARGEAGDDTKQSILGCALKRLIPECWSVSAALPYIQARADDRYYGTYSGFLDFDLPKYVTLNDVPSVLEWLRGNLAAFDSLSELKNFVKRVLDLALQKIDSDEVAKPFVRLWIDLAAQHRTTALASTFGLKEMFSKDIMLRRKVVGLLLNAKLPDSLDIWNLFYEFDVIATADEFEWLLDQVLIANPEAQKSWASLIGMHVYNPQLRVPSWDKFLFCLEKVPDLRQMFEWLRAWELKEPVARQSKAKFLRDQRRRNALQRRVNRRSWDPRQIREQALQHAQKNPAKAWWSLWNALHWGNDPREQPYTVSIDVEGYKGWELLSDDQKELARTCAREFLLHCPDDTSSWQPGSEASICSTAAIRLLQNELLNDNELMQAVSEKWIWLFAGFHFNEDHGAEKLFALLDQINHGEALAALMADFERDGSQIKRPFAIRVAKKCWDDRYNHALKRYVESLTDPKSIYETIDEWKDMAPAAASEYILGCLPMIISKVGDTYPICLKLTISAAILAQPVEAFRITNDLLNTDRALAESVWSLVFHDIDTREDAWWKKWNEAEMAALYLHLVKILPRSGDPHHENGFVAPRTSAAWSRDRIPARIAERSNRAACQALSLLIHELPDQARILRWSHRQALIQCRRNEWCPPEVADVLKLIKNSNTRLITSEQDLQEAVLESLERYQHRLTNDAMPAVVGLWNQSVGAKNKKGQLRPKDEKALQHDVARWLRDDLEKTRGIIANCEVEPRLGSYTDIYVNAVRPGQQNGFEKMTVVIEVKGCWHKDVKSAMHTQLIKGYLRPNGLIAGIYLLGWFVCDACPDAGNCTGLATIEEAKSWFSQQVACYDGKTEGEFVRSVVLDCRWPQSSPSRAKT